MSDDVMVVTVRHVDGRVEVPALLLPGARLKFAAGNIRAVGSKDVLNYKPPAWQIEDFNRMAERLAVEGVK